MSEYEQAVERYYTETYPMAQHADNGGIDPSPATEGIALHPKSYTLNTKQNTSLCSAQKSARPGEPAMIKQEDVCEECGSYLTANEGSELAQARAERDQARRALEERTNQVSALKAALFVYADHSNWDGSEKREWAFTEEVGWDLAERELALQAKREFLMTSDVRFDQSGITNSLTTNEHGN